MERRGVAVASEVYYPTLADRILSEVDSSGTLIARSEIGAARAMIFATREPGNFPTQASTEFHAAFYSLAGMRMLTGKELPFGQRIGWIKVAAAIIRGGIRSLSVDIA
jgi:hypothetical protein